MGCVVDSENQGDKRGHAEAKETTSTRAHTAAGVGYSFWIDLVHHCPSSISPIDSREVPAKGQIPFCRV